MKVLLAPAETKNSGGEETLFSKENFFLVKKFSLRQEAFEVYEKHVQSLSLQELSSWFGIKKLDDVKKYQESLRNKPSMKAIQRYNGVAFDALEYNSLTKEEQNYIDENVILFSNLFGPIKASDKIPDYKFKQGAKLANMNIEKFYKDNFSKDLDEYIGDEIIDLRAGFYEKFYTPKDATVITIKFLKDGKVVSHWAKHYRGMVLNTLAKKSVQSITEFMNTEIPGLELVEIQEKKNIKLLIMNIK
ncbi:YaaA family protein [Arcobacter sp.]|uniref:YaaA family protein n=1 Tax=unclassified Arcobacter TaxID=2593671 RepID=UPI003B00EF21|eukprot:TRINITY_DN3048_c0_g1_i1.p2 TRINITY_DN3048_c0_g1~~TRINITY_DN3048_c0_g1_i1.p2  ORF type:complete len:246 (+),score=-33.65 TRINITY_DN3048_c0_g1_i1:1932-2669(+)